MEWLKKWLLAFRAPNLPLRITDENLAEIRTQYPRLAVMQSKRCPICASYLVAKKVSGWMYDDQGRRSVHSIRLEVFCPNCQAQIVDDPFVPDNDREPIAVAPFQTGWVKCPHCGRRFSLANPNSWTGQLHRTCGQRLIIQALPGDAGNVN